MKEPREYCFHIPDLKIRLFPAALLLLIWIGLLITNCAPKPKILPQDRTPENVLRCVQKNRIEFTSQACLLNLRLKGKEAKFSGEVEIFYQAPDSFAFYPRSFLGADIFKAVGAADTLTVYFPGENQYFSGEISDLENTRLWSWNIPFQMLLNLILRKEGLMEPEVQFAGKTEKYFVYRYEDEDWIKEYHVDAERCRLVKTSLTQKSGGDNYQIEYKSYTKYDSYEVPRVVKIISSGQENALIKYEERKFNLSIPATKLRLQIPADSKRVDLRSQESE
ncbi:MAG: DUF4292 domain-containing protein [Candidatus Zixiibacteriota bacterium]